jgi:putative addiction module component (TIGR02574 family)
MPYPIQEIDVSDLSSAERLQLAQVLLDSVMVEAEGEPFTPEQLAEIDRRVAEIDSGQAVLEPWESARDRLLSRK